MVQQSNKRTRSDDEPAARSVRRASLWVALFALLFVACGSELGSTQSGPSVEYAAASEPIELVEALPTLNPEPTPVTVSTSAITAPEPPPVQGRIGRTFEEQATADACFAGSMRQCDQLFQQSEAGSSAETYGATCGLRVDPPGYACATAFLSKDITLGTLLAEGVNVRSTRSLDSEVVGQLVDSTGAMIPITGDPIDGWYPIVHQFRSGWIFGAFVSPEVDGEVVVRTTSRDIIKIVGPTGSPIEADTGSFGLVIEQAAGSWTLLLPDGQIAFVDPSTVDVVAG